jgi:hypothetical protein
MVGGTMQLGNNPKRLCLDINLGIFDKLKEISILEDRNHAYQIR